MDPNVLLEAAAEKELFAFIAEKSRSLSVEAFDENGAAVEPVTQENLATVKTVVMSADGRTIRHAIVDPSNIGTLIIGQ